MAIAYILLSPRSSGICIRLQYATNINVRLCMCACVCVTASYHWSDLTTMTIRGIHAPDSSLSISIYRLTAEPLKRCDTLQQETRIQTFPWYYIYVHFVKDVPCFVRSNANDEQQCVGLELSYSSSSFIRSRFENKKRETPITGIHTGLLLINQPTT